LKTSLEPWAGCMPERKRADGFASADASAGSASAASQVGSLAQIYDAHFAFVWRNARRLGVSETNADDVVQDVFVIIQRRIQDFDGRTHLRAWIFGILVRVVNDHRRSYRRKGARCVPLEDEASQSVAAPQATPVELAERAQRVQLLDTLLCQLDEDKRSLLILAELEQWTLREIAEYSGSNINTVYSRLRAAKREFDKVHAGWLANKGKAP
jgi:RNA polymerase sigma-70 factor, ECF subfamily